MCDIYGDKLSFSKAYRWLANFKRGLQQLKGAARPGRPAISTTKGNIQINPQLAENMPDIP